MEKNPNPFDDFLKEALKGHQLAPNEKARKAFLEEASTIIPARKGWKNWYYLPVIIIFLSGLIVIIVFRNGQKFDVQTVPETIITTLEINSDPAAPLIESSKQTTASNSEHDQKISSSIIPAGNDLSPVNQSISEQTNVKLQLTDEIHESISNEINYTIADTIQKSSNDDIFQLSESGIPGAIIAVNQTDPTKIPTENPPALNNQTPPVADTSVKLTEPLNPYPAENLQNILTWKFATGVYYLPEMMYNTLEDGKFVNNFGIDAIFYRGPVSIRTGAGISVSKGITTNSVEYNDYLGAYNKLDSITFVYNEPEHNFEPNVFMSTEKVWDTLAKSDSTELIKRYTYLQVPLVLGFDFWHQGRFSMGVRVGTIMSVMLKSHQLTGEYDPGENQVLGISKLTPGQANVNWQAIGGINLSAVLSRRIGIEIEPQAKYYYGSIYEKSGNVKKPWSIGIRAGVIYKF